MQLKPGQLKKGDNVYCNVHQKNERYIASVLDFDGERIALSVDRNASVHMYKGLTVTITSEEDELVGEVYEYDDKAVKLRCIGASSRNYFRVDDSLKILIKKTDFYTNKKRSKLITDFTSAVTDSRMYVMDVPDESISPVLWKMLVDINTKLGLVVDMLTLNREGLASAEETEVNISASGLRLKLEEKFDVNDFVEVKILLPTSPPVGIVVYGIIVRVTQTERAVFDMSINFIEMEEAVRDEIIRYTLNRERELIRKQKGMQS